MRPINAILVLPHSLSSPDRAETIGRARWVVHYGPPCPLQHLLVLGLIAPENARDGCGVKSPAKCSFFPVSTLFLPHPVIIPWITQNAYYTSIFPKF